MAEALEKLNFSPTLGKRVRFSKIHCLVKSNFLKSHRPVKKANTIPFHKALRVKLRKDLQVNPTDKQTAENSSMPARKMGH